MRAVRGARLAWLATTPWTTRARAVGAPRRRRRGTTTTRVDANANANANAFFADANRARDVDQRGDGDDGIARAMGRAKVLVVTGPTAIGKSAVAIALARARREGRDAREVEIVSCDSVQIYRGLDVGSGKVGARELEACAHHMLSALDPRARDGSGEYDASAYYDDAVNVIDDIHRRGRDAVVVGGAGMYLKWLTDGKPSAPGSTPETREAAERAVGEARARGGWREAVELLTRAGDAETGKTLSENDWYRLTRAYEIVRASGQSVKTFAREHPEARFDFRCFFLSSPRVELYRKIDARVEGMFVDGIMDEAAWLLNAGIAPGENVPARSIGYRQAMEYLVKARAKEIQVDDASLLELVNEIQMLNRAYAKRQFTWFRGESRYAWINVDDDRDAVARRILSEFDRDEHRAGGEEIGDLSKDELNLLKRYRPALTVLSDKRTVKRVLDSISALV